MNFNQFSLLASALAMTLAASHLQAAPIKDSSTEMDQASQAAVTVYRNKGNPGLQQAIADCYKSVGYATPFCVYMDVAGREIDFSVAQAYKELGQNVAPHAYSKARHSVSAWLRFTSCTAKPAKNPMNTCRKSNHKSKNGWKKSCFPMVDG